MDKTTFESLEDAQYGPLGSPKREKYEKEFLQHMLEEERKYNRSWQRFYLYAIISIVVTLLLQLIDSIAFGHSKLMVFVGSVLVLGSMLLLIIFIRHMRKRPA